jgi:hypothetical protein
MEQTQIKALKMHFSTWIGALVSERWKLAMHASVFAGIVAVITDGTLNATPICPNHTYEAQ